MDKPEIVRPTKTSSSILINGLGAFFIAMIGFIIIGPIIGVLISLPFYDGNLMDFATMLQSPVNHPEFKVPLYIIQGTATLIGLAALPLLFLHIRHQMPVKNFFHHHSAWLAYGLTAVLVITFMGFNSWFIEWNAGIHLPESLRSFEEWARSKEDLATQLTDYLTTFDSTAQIILAFFVIAVIPAIGEELVFRGILQGYIQRSGVNPHVAIWIAAFLFSTIHFQFFGFIPRLFLGALFGYLYYWSNDLKVPILAHFVNNGFTLMLVYLHQKGMVDMNIDDPGQTSLSTAVIFTIITVVLLIVLYRHFSIRRTDGTMAESF